MSIQNTAAASLLVDVIRDLAGQAWKASTSKDTVKESIEKVVGKAVDAAIATIRAELVAEFAALQLAYDIRSLADGPQKVLDAFTPTGDFPQLGLDITWVKPGELDQTTTVEPIDDKFDSGDK